MHHLRRHPRPTLSARPVARLTCAAVLAGTLLLSGCGGSSEASGTDTAAASDGGDAASTASADAYRECLADQGVELPEMGQGGPPDGGTPPDGAAPADGAQTDGAQTDGAQTDGAQTDGAGPSGGGAPPQDDEFAAAQEACADLAPEGGMGGPGGGPGGGQGGGPGGMGGEEMQAYMDCLTEQGVEIEQPAAPTSGAGRDGGTQNGGGQPPAGGPGAFAELDDSDPAVTACADLRPEMPERPADSNAGSSDEATSSS